jgi:hypothetical protein
MVKKMKHHSIRFLLFIALTQSGCSLFFGNVKPVEEKSDSYGILDLSKVNSDWTRLDPKGTTPHDQTPDAPPPESGISDVVFQSKKSASIISLNSACNRYKKVPQNPDLKALTRELFLGLSEMHDLEQANLIIQETPALQTTIQGKLNGESMKLRTVVLQRSHCVYDLMYIARPERFLENEDDFSHFVSSLRLR